LPKKRKRKIANLKYFFARIIYLSRAPLNVLPPHKYNQQSSNRVAANFP